MSKKRTGFRWRRWLVISGLGLVGLVIVLVLLAPTILTSITYPPLTFDLSPFLNEKTASLVTNRTATLEIEVRRGSMEGYDIRAHGMLLDWPYSVRMDLLPSFRFLGVDVTGELEAWLDDTPWTLHADFNASSSGEWRADIEIPETQVTETDPVVGTILSRLPMPAVSNLVFTGTFGLKAEGARTNRCPVAKWKALGTLKDFNVACFAKGLPVEVSRLRMSMGGAGIADHVDIRPMFPRADVLKIGVCTMTNAFASIRATETAYLVTEAGADCCGGELKLYSFFLDSNKLNAGVTLFVDGVDAGEVLRLLRGFKGEATGRLYGKIPLHLRNGEELRLRGAYLHSAPGETGTLKVFDPQSVVENLALGGVPEATCANAAKALADLSYSVLRLGLQPEEDGGMALSVKIAGTATHKGVTVPVSFEVTFHGEIEQLINTGLKLKIRKK